MEMLQIPFWGWEDLSVSFVLLRVYLQLQIKSTNGWVGHYIHLGRYMFT